jgi:hypothetical protein
VIAFLLQNAQNDESLSALVSALVPERLHIIRDMQFGVCGLHYFSTVMPFLQRRNMLDRDFRRWPTLLHGS